MGKQLEFFFDVGSPMSYLAWTQLPALLAETAAAVVYRPMLLGGVFQATGNASPGALPAKGRYTEIDMLRHARRYGVPMRMNPHFPINTLTLMRAVAGVQLRQPARLEAFVDAVFRAIWEQGADFNDVAVVGKVLADAGFDPREILALTAEADVKTTLRATTEDAVARGVFGAPTIFVGDAMFFGQDRLDFVREALVQD